MAKCYDQAMNVKRDIENAKEVIVCCSGGKDSVAMLLRLLELNVHIDKIIFADTLWEYPEMYGYLDRLEAYIDRPIIRLTPPDNLWDKWFYGEVTRGENKGKIRGYPLIAFSCWYTREAKVLPIEKACVKAKVVYVGIAADEAHRCSSKDDFIQYPLVEWGWTEQDCVDYLNEREMLNPLYKNFNRTGCFHCPKQHESSLYVLWKTHPELWQKLKYYDVESQRIADHGATKHNLNELEKRFSNPLYQPPRIAKYECVGCDAVASAFKIRQAKLEAWIENKKNGVEA